MQPEVHERRKEKAYRRCRCFDSLLALSSKAVLTPREMPPARDELLTDLLRSVSRSFYTTLRILPPQIRPQISLAYLLARTTDTIADTGLVPVAERLGAL